MQCKKVRNHLSAYLDRELTAELASAVRHHLASCPECRAMLEDLRATADLLGRLPVREAPAGLADDVRLELERRMLAPQAADDADMSERTLAAHTVRQWPRVLAVAACVALAAGIGVVAYLGTEAWEESSATGPAVVRHDATEMATEYAAGPETEGAAAGRAWKGPAAGGEVVDEAFAKGPAYGAGAGSRLAGPGEGLDLRLRTKDAPAARHDVRGEPHVVDLDAYALTNGLDPGTLAIDLAGAHDDKASSWYMKEESEGREAHGYFDYAGSRHPAGPSVGLAVQDGAYWGTYDAPDAGDTHVAFVDPAPKAGAAPAEVLFGRELRGGEAGDVDRNGVAVLGDGFARANNVATPGNLGLDMAGALTAGGPADGPTDAETDAAAEADAIVVAGGTGVDIRPGKRGLDETAGLDDGLMARAVPATPAERDSAAPATAPAAAPTQPAAPQLVQMTMNYVAVGQAPLGSLREVANKDNLSVASNQLVVRAPSRETANEDLVRLFARNGWRELDEQSERDRARKKAEARGTARPEVTAGVPGRGTVRGAPEGLYYRAAHNGEDLWVVVTTPDDLSRFATQVARLRTVEVAEESSEPFQAVRYLQRQLARFEAKAGADDAAAARMAGERAGTLRRGRRFGATNGAVPKGGAGAGPEGENVAGQRMPGLVPSQVGTGRTDNGRGRESESVRQAPAPGEALQQKAKEAGEELAERPALQPQPAEPAPAEKPQPEAAQAYADQLAQAEVGETPEPAPRPMGQKAAEPAAEKPGEEAVRSETKPAEDEPEAAALQKGMAVRQQPAAAQQRFSFQIIPPNQVMLVVRVRSADDPPQTAAEALQEEAKTAEPAAAQQRVEPAAKE
jgi:hypothetical protein